MVDVIKLTITMLGTLLGWEGVKYLLNRKSNSRIEEARADSAEFNVLKDAMIFLQGQVRDKEERFAEQTAHLRAVQAENLELHKRVAMLEAERALKLCERRGCPTREPQSGY